ncbi:hypothetical protein BLA60_26900 [Actinophytocola xinjiangensis]|uniref:Uncharacterized protein n=1 Tax=Actinophytocola xinjiangensis TaxID=485602 RepID=A0A7Z0WJF2_9PSEU|nr:hypothetical protein [Actinophytocola xinjiangensis]OLF07552.1 hypothetical protein BLA60_26900 [Actinophytocola xinjiangensis]
MPQPLVPYVSSWSTEDFIPSVIVERPGVGIAYADETVFDRDSHGVLWYRTPHSPHQGRPRYSNTHPQRQRRAMQRLLCQVCANPADHTTDGVLWLLQDHRTDWPGWPNNMTVTEPPICATCVPIATRHCPALRRSAITIRARTHPIHGVNAQLYKASPRGPVPTTKDIVAYTDPTIRWARATDLVRLLRHCTILDPSTLTR